MEEWKYIIGYEGYYEVSNFGNVRSVDRWIYGRGRKKKQLRHGNIMRPKTDRYGYFSIQLIRENKRQHITVHRLVAIAFLPNPDKKPQVNHMDCNKKNNTIENLEWCTNQQNVIHAYKNGRISKAVRGNHGRSKISLDLRTGIFYDCGKDAADSRNIPYSIFKEAHRSRNINKTDFIYV